MDPNQTQQDSQQAQKQETPAPGVPEDYRARFEAADKEIKALREEAASRRVKAKEATAAAEKAAEEQGQYKALADSLKARVGELEPLEADAKQWRAHVERESQRLAKVREGLPAHWQAALDASPSLDGKQAILSAYESERAAGAGNSKQPAKAPAPGNPPGAAASHDWQALAANPAALKEAKARDPQGWRAFIDGFAGRGAKPQTTAERRFALFSSKNKAG